MVPIYKKKKGDVMEHGRYRGIKLIRWNSNEGLLREWWIKG